MAKSTQSGSGRKAAPKPAKPYPDFPLYAHASGRWAKKIRGKLRYFGKWADPDAALRKYLDDRDDLYAGRTPRSKRDGLTVRELANRFLSAKKSLVESGELTQITWNDYHRMCRQLAELLGAGRIVDDLHPGDFEKLRADFAKTCGLVAMKNRINHARMLFKFAHDAQLIDRPVRFGPMFKRPAAKAIRKQRTPKMFERDEILKMLDAANPVARAMVLLGINCAFGNGDVSRLPKSALDMKGGWVTYARAKTGTERRIPLWPETVSALAEAIRVRPDPKSPELDGLVFLTRAGGSYWKASTTYLSEQFRKFLRGENLYRRGVGFYGFRHCFGTIGGESRDQVAVDAIMGHERGHMSAAYRERISDERLRDVTEAVRKWLYGSPGEG